MLQRRRDERGQVERQVHAGQQRHVHEDVGESGRFDFTAQTRHKFPFEFSADTVFVYGCMDVWTVTGCVTADDGTATCLCNTELCNGATSGKVAGFGTALAVVIATIAGLAKQ